MRMSRTSWLSRFFGARPVPKKEKPKGTGREPVDWVVVVSSDQACTVSALTKSEARAAAKKALKIKGRLPVGAVAIPKLKKAA